MEELKGVNMGTRSKSSSRGLSRNRKNSKQTERERVAEKLAAKRDRLHIPGYDWVRLTTNAETPAKRKTIAWRKRKAPVAAEVEI